MSAVIASLLLFVGSIFCLVAAVGMLRLPDTLIRMHAATKAGTLGAGCILAAEAVVADELRNHPEGSGGDCFPLAHNAGSGTPNQPRGLLPRHPALRQDLV